MKTALATVLVILGTAVATPAEDKLSPGQEVQEAAANKLKLAYEMQEAILRTQDLRKVQDLLARGVDINAPIGCGTFSALDGAVQTQNVEMLKLLLAHGAKPRGRELADAAFASGHQEAMEMAKALLEAGVAPNARNDHSHPLIQATYRGNQDLIRLLLSQRGLKLDETDVDGYTALMWAVKHGSTEIVDLLLRAGANAGVANERGETAATVAQEEIDKQNSIITRLKTPGPGGLAGDRSAAIPEEFLRTGLPAWERILATEVTADFKEMPIRDLLSYLGLRNQANLILALEGPGPGPAAIDPSAGPQREITFTHHCDRAPLRAVLYQLSRDTGLTVDWDLERGFPRAIRITGKPRQ